MDVALGDVASSVSALISAARLALDQYERGSQPEAKKAELHAALMRFEEAVSLWIDAAKETNGHAQLWRAGPPRAAELVRGYIRSSSRAQLARTNEVMLLLNTPVIGGVASRWLRSNRRRLLHRHHGAAAEPTLAGILRVHAPDAESVTDVLTDRNRLLATLEHDLERRYEREGMQGVHQLLSDLKDSLVRLESAHEELRRFIEARFPVGSQKG